MAKQNTAVNGNRSAKSTKAKPSWWSEFIPDYLTPEQVEDMKGWEPHADELVAMFNRLKDDGYSTIIKDDPQGNGFLVILRPNSGDHIHKGFQLSGRGSTWLKALRRVLYRHFTVYNEEWPTDTIEDRSAGYDD